MTDKPTLATTALATMDLQLPRITPTVDHSDGSPQGADDAPAAPLPGSGSVSLDVKGQSYDPNRHVVPPRRNKAGEWAKKPGNAQLKAAGKPLAGKAFTAGPRDVPPGNKVSETAPAAPAGDAGGPISDLGQSAVVVMPPGATEPLPVLLTLEDYQATSESLARGFFAGMTLAVSPAWEPQGGELPALTGALQRVWFHYQLPRVSPLIELATVFLGLFAKRRSDPGTVSMVGKLRGLFRRKSTATAPASDAVDQVPATVPRGRAF